MNKRQLVTLGTMTEQQKSVLLAKAMGWEVSPLGSIFPTEGEGHVAIHPESSRYDPNEMALAWRVLNWWANIEPRPQEQWEIFLGWWALMEVYTMPANEVQRAWLDKIIILVIEAGLVKNERDSLEI